MRAGVGTTRVGVEDAASSRAVKVSCPERARVDSVLGFRAKERSGALGTSGVEEDEDAMAEGLQVRRLQVEWEA